jgi:ABC-type bacteriocin/lantibiotic exporter with double-glycine peptidase domain
MDTLKKISHLLTPQEHKRAILLLLMVLVMAFLEMLGLVSILPFMAVLSNPDIVETNTTLKNIYHFTKNYGIENNQQFLFLLGILVFVMLVLSLFFKALTIYVQVRFTTMCQYSISSRVIKGYLNEAYSWFLSRHSADLGKTILSEVAMVVTNGLNPLINLVVRSIVAITILILLIVIDPKLAVIVGLTLGLAYGLIYKLIRNFLKHISQERFKANQWRYTAVSEAFGAIKEIKLGGLEQIYTDRFSNPAKSFATHTASFQVLNQLPRFALEAIAFGGMLLILLYLMAQSGDFVNAVPVIALYTFAGYRLMPALQGIYGSISQLRFVGPALDALHKDLLKLKAAKFDNDKNILPLKKNILLNNIDYNYPNSSRTALKNLHLTIPARSTVGIVGATGSGKTTTVDIILGLLKAQKGSLQIDGQVISENNKRAWQRTIGYVPQQIYLADDSIASNIAFGIDYKDINQKKVERAAKIANLHDFVVKELPNKYKTTVGERGIRLSGGQRQRIGIARALYNNPQVLIFDEATSALDNLTEQIVMDSVHKIGSDITIILIAHRLSTVKECDTIFLLEKGELKAEGTFENLIKMSESFRKSAKRI